MGVEFNLKVIERDGVNVFELVDGDVSVCFNRVSAALIDESNKCIVVLSPADKELGTVSTERRALGGVDAALDVADFNVGDQVAYLAAREVANHSFSASQLIVHDYRGHEMARIKSAYNNDNNDGGKVGDDLGEYFSSIDRLNAETKAPEQQILMFK